MKRTSTLAVVAAAALALCALPPAAPAQTRPALGAPYSDELNGFSLRPPLQTEKLRESSPRRLVCWVRRDEKTNAVRWSLEVLRTRHEPTKLPMDEYVKAVARELARSARFQVESTQVGTVAGSPAMHFRGMWKGALTLWRRQTWVRMKRGEYLVLNIAGPVSDKAEMDAVLTAVAGTLKLFDPSAVLEERRKNLARAAEVLAGLKEAGLRPLLAGEPYYFLLQLKGETIGFLSISEALAQSGKDRGLRVVRGGALTLPGQPRRLTREELFATADRKVERWRRVVVDGRGQEAVASVSEAIKQQDLLLVQTKQAGRPTPSRKRTLPSAIRPAYLPGAFDVLAPRLIDRSKPATYGFAVYNAAANDFDLRTLSVVGPETITLAGKQVAAVRLVDQMARDAPAASLWVDQKGLLLRMQTAEGVKMERIDRTAVAVKFAAELVELERLGSKKR